MLFPNRPEDPMTSKTKRKLEDWGVVMALMLTELVILLGSVVIEDLI